MKRLFFTILAGLMLSVFATPLLADNLTGLYSSDRNGVGLSLYEREDGNIAFVLYDYVSRCKSRVYEAEAVIEDERYWPCRPQAVFFVTGPTPLVADQAIGVLYLPVVASNWPVPVEGSVLEEMTDVGLFFLTRTESGFNMIVLPTGSALNESAELYHHLYQFEYLYGPTFAGPFSE